MDNEQPVGAPVAQPAASPTPEPAVAAAPPVAPPEDKLAEIVKSQEAALKKVTDEAERKVRELTEKFNNVTGYSQRQLRSMEAALKTAEAKLREYAPEAGDSVRLAQLEAEKQISQQQDTEEMSRRQQLEYHAAVMSELQAFVTDNGIDLNDPDIDWGKDAKTYPELYKRVQASVTKKNKANLAKAKAEAEKLVKDTEARIRRDLGFDSVDTQTPTAGGSGDYKAALKYWYDHRDDPKAWQALQQARAERQM